jgi:predicted house-cleaning noncanonical NTP pyrophosphatase (MazG superfamily)
MKYIAIFIVCILLLLCSHSLKATQPVDENSALRYLLAVCYMPDLSKDDLYSLANVNDIESFKQLPFKLKKRLPGRFKEIYKLLNNARSCKYSTYLVNKYSWKAITPPYRTLRGFSSYLLAISWKEISDGNFARGIDLIIHTVRLAQSIASDGPVVSAMIGGAITDEALDSIENLLKLNLKPEIKEKLKKFIGQLPSPYVNYTNNLKYENLYWKSFLESARETPEILVKLAPFKNHKNENRAAKPDLCSAYQRVILSAIELARADKINLSSINSTEAIIKKLLDDKYLRKKPECPKGGKYQIDLVNSNDCVIKCSCGATILSTNSFKDRISSKTLEQINEYMKTNFSKDAEEVAALGNEISQIMVKFDQTSQNKAEEIQKKIDEGSNLLAKSLLIKPGIIMQKGMKLNERINKIKRILNQ